MRQATTKDRQRRAPRGGRHHVGSIDDGFGAVMAAAKKVSVSSGPTTHQLTPAERREANIRKIAGQQSELKREAAERREDKQRRQSAAPPADTP
ncbi:MAG TPA: hypothetical protein VIK04_17360 [Solirubrobacteraceae bacterium]